MKTPLKVAVIGCGHLGAIHARKLANSTDTELAYVVDPSEAHRQRVAEETGATPLASHQLASDVDAAFIATPTRTHFSVAADLLSRGIHVFVEKPLTPTGEEAAELCRLAQRHRALLQVGHVERFNPAMLAVESHIQEPKYIELRRCSGFSFRSVDIGAVLDLMIHDIDIAIQLAGSDVTQVSAFGFALLGRREDVARARLQFANGCMAELYASRISQERVRQMNVMGECYSASVDFDAPTAELTVADEQLSSRSFDAEMFSATERCDLGPQHYATLFHSKSLNIAKHDAIEAEHANFTAAIQGQAEIKVTGQVGCRAVQVAEQILAEIESHEWDGRSSGRIGPTFEYPPHIIRPAQWQPLKSGQRKAG